MTDKNEITSSPSYKVLDSTSLKKDYKLATASELDEVLNEEELDNYATKIIENNPEITQENLVNKMIETSIKNSSNSFIKKLLKSTLKYYKKNYVKKEIN